MAGLKEYRAIDIRAGNGWPEAVPPLTEAEAIRAARRLWRWGVGTTFTGVVKITSGNRRAARIHWEGGVRCISVNPSQGWKDFAHSMSHWLDHVVNGSSSHSKHHARFEKNLIRQIVTRGWLDGRLKDDPPAAPSIEVAVEDAKRAAAIKRKARIEELELAWRRKQSRAVNALAKLAKEKKRVLKKIGD